MQQKRDRSLREMETGSESYESGGEEGMEILEEEEEEEDKELDFRKLCLQEGWMADDGEEEEEEHELQGSQLAVGRASVETTTTIPAWEEEELGMGELEEACVTSSFSSSLPLPLEKGGREKKILGKSLQRKNECIEESSLQMLDSMSKPPPPPPPPPDDDDDGDDDDDDDNGGAEMIEISPGKSTQLQVDHKGCRHDTMESEVLDMLTVDAEKEMAAAAVMDVVVSLPAHDRKKQSNSSAVGKQEEEDHFRQFGNTNSLAEEEAREVSSQQDVHDPTSANEYPANCNRVAVTEVKKVPKVVELSTSCSPCIPIVDDDCTAAANALVGKDESHKEENLQQQRRRRRKKDGNVEEERVVEGAVVIVHHAQQCDNNELLKNHHQGGVVAEEDAFLMGNRMGCCCLDAEAESKHNRAENEGGAIRAAALVADDGGEKYYGGGGALSSSSSLLYNSASFGNTRHDNGVVVAEEEDIKQEMEEEACNGEEDGDRGIDIKSQKRKYVGEAEAKQKQQQVCKLQNELLQEVIMLAECPPPTPLPPCGGGSSGCAGDVQQSGHCASVAKQNQSVTHATSRARCVDANLRQPPAVGFTAHQLGQLYSLMHEHVQLLIQVFALSILEPAQQQTAIETHHMLVDLMQSRDWMLMWKKTAFPDFCFGLPFIHPSVVVDNSNSSSSMCDPSPATKNPHSQVVAAVVKLSEPTTPDSLPSEIRNTHLQTDNIPDLGRSSNSLEKMLPLEAASQTEHRSSIPCPSVSNAASAFPSSPSEWVPKTCGSVRTLLDVAPLHLVNEFLTDIAQVVQNYRQQHVESGAYHAECERDTLFPTVKLQADHDLVAEGGSSSSSSSKKKQSVALVPKGISKSVRRFLPLFNKGLFPNKAPPATTANRMLFTDAEDELLAMGMITYNTDWLAIQRRFLPSKSVHQIFVRQKNRSCARSPENPIKAVRRMKSAPFTAEEKECIEEALIVYKHDWARIWQFCVPHRDPVALPRQWRVALGTQKLYESHEMNEEKRQAYETGRHLNTLTSSPRDEMPSSSMWVNDLIQGPVECIGDGDTNDTEDKDAHILNAFFAEWKPRSPLAWLAEGRPCMPEPGGALSSSSTIVSKTQDHIKGGHVPTLPVLLPLPIPAAAMPPPMYPYSPYAPPIHTFPSRQQAKKWLVKLAPGLPSLKLPPTVQVLSQSKGGEHPKTVTHLGCSRGGAGSQANFPGPQGIELTGSDAIPPIKLSTVLPPASSSRKASVQEEVVLGKRIKCDWQLPNPDLAPKRKCVENDAASINNQIGIQHNQAAASVRQQRQQPPPRSHPVVSQQQTAGRRSLKTLLMKPASSSSPATRGSRTMPFPIATLPSDDIKVLAGQVPLHYQSPHFHPFFGAPPPTPIVVSKFLPANLPPPCTNSPTPSMVLHRTGINNRPAAPTVSKNGQQHASI